MLGQDRLLSLIDSYTIDTFPNSFILLGEYGSGRHTILNSISTKFNLQNKDITDSINYETIEDIKITPIPSLFVIDISKINIKEQNIILKILEEPNKNIFFGLVVENINLVLETVKNRCQIFKLQPYSIEMLEEICGYTDDYIFEYASTPGQVKEFSNYDIVKTEDLCKKMISSYKKTGLADTLKLSRSFDYKDDYSKINFRLFKKVMIKVIEKQFIDTHDKVLIDLYNKLSVMIKDSLIGNIDESKLFETFLLETVKNAA